MTQSNNIQPPNSSPSPLIVCENLVKIYKVAELEVVALQGMDLLALQFQSCPKLKHTLFLLSNTPSIYNILSC